MTMTLKDIYKALGNDETLINKITGLRIHMEGNRFVQENGKSAIIMPFNPEIWEIYKDPKDPKNWIGKICWFWDDINKDDNKYLGLLKSYNTDAECPFIKENDTRWQHCRPLTKKEVEQYLIKEN